ncbi:MAG: ferredoxin--NADP reductase, partial [bacterium]
KEVDPTADGIVLVSTGTGIGPLYGFSQDALARDPKLPITLLAGFREPQDSCLRGELERLGAGHPNFQWRFSLSEPDATWAGLRGRVTETLPDLLGPVGKLHFHLVGNGNMVVELYEALMLAGLRDERVTSEIYFNYPENLDRAKLEALAARFRL